ncbi:MAG: M16 family metallopeptidase [Gammaproteobacteria bacterium]
MHTINLKRTAGAAAIACALAALGAPAHALVLPKGVAQGPSAEGITEYRLANGLKVLLFPDASKPTTTVNMTYLVGSRHENMGETGMAHLLEHLLFKGAPGYTDITKQFAARGMRFNGSTSEHRTNYFQSFKADDDNLKWSLNMEAARMTKSFVSRKDLDSEMTVVRNEFEMGESDPGSVLFRELQSIAYDWHGVGHSPIGNRSDIENVRIENLQAFYRTWYQPDNAVLLVAGKFDETRMLAWVAQAFGKIPKPKRKLPVSWTVEPPQDGERSFVVRRKGDYQMLALGYKGPSSLHADMPALNVLAGILSDSPNGRLHKQLVVPGKAVQTFAWTSNSPTPGLEFVGAVVKKDEPIEPAKAALLAAVEQVASEPPTQEEVARIQRNYANDMEKTLNDAERVGVQLSEAIALGDWRMFFYQRDAIAKVTPKDVVEVARRYFKPTNRVLGHFIPTDEADRVQIAAAPDVTAVLANYTAKPAAKAGEDFAPTPDNINKRTQLDTIGGLKVALLPKATRGQTVAVRLDLHWGDEASLFGKKGVGTLTNQMLMRGTSKYTREQLADEWQKLKIAGDLYSFETTREHLPAAMRLVAHVLREASFPQSEFDQLLKQTVVGIEAQRSDPNAVAQRSKAIYMDPYPKGDIRAPMTLDEELALFKAVKLEDVKAFHRDFYGASHGELAVVGDFDPAEIRKVAAEAFGGWASKAPYKRLPNQYFDVKPTAQKLDTPDKENASYVAEMNLQMRSDDPDYPAMLMASYIFGQGGLKSRLMDRLRQKDGLSYGGAGWVWADDLDRVAKLGIFAIAAPQNMAKVDAAVRQELALAVEKGFTPEEVADARKGLLEGAAQEHSQDTYLAQRWASHRYLERDFNWDKKLEAKLAALSPARVSAAFKKAIDPARLAVFIAADSAKAQAAGAP